MSIFQNAIDSIEVGVEDFAHKEKRRYVSALRNIYAGILLLCKYKLCTLSPDYDKELLIKKTLIPYQEKNGIIFKGSGKQTVDMQLIQERFQALKVLFDFQKLKKIQTLRNNIEHYYSQETTEVISQVLSYSFLLIRDFVTTELNKDPSQVFSNKCWEIFLKNHEVYETEKSLCADTLDNVNWKYESLEEFKEELYCPQCYSELICAPNSMTDLFPEINLNCKSCGYEFKFSDQFDEEIRDISDSSFAYKNSEVLRG